MIPVWCLRLHTFTFTVQMLYVYGFCRSFLSKLLLMNQLSLTCFSLIRLSTMIWSNHGNAVSGQTIPDDAFRMLWKLEKKQESQAGSWKNWLVFQTSLISDTHLGWFEDSSRFAGTGRSVDHLAESVAAWNSPPWHERHSRHGHCGQPSLEGNPTNGQAQWPDAIFRW